MQKQQKGLLDQTPPPPARLETTVGVCWAAAPPPARTSQMAPASRPRGPPRAASSSLPTETQGAWVASALWRSAPGCLVQSLEEEQQGGRRWPRAQLCSCSNSQPQEVCVRSLPTSSLPVWRSHCQGQVWKPWGPQPLPGQLALQPPN